MEGESLEESNLTPLEIGLVAKVSREFGIRSVKITGGEPTLRKDITEIIYYLKYFSKVEEVSLTTNGVLLSKLAPKMKEAGLDRVNISLHTSSRERFREITNVDAFEKVIEGIKAAIEVGLRPVKLNFVVNKKNYDETFKIIDLAEKLGVDEVHLIELHPVGLGKSAFSFHKDLKEIEDEIKEKAVHIDIRNKHYRPRYKLPSGLVIEIVKPYSNPLFCAGCNRIRLTADGKLKTCLYREDKVIDILDIIRGPYELNQKFELLRRAFSIAMIIREPNFKFTLKFDDKLNQTLQSIRIKEY
jgi:cyclic pyranopterin phosphate synthase